MLADLLLGETVEDTIQKSVERVIRSMYEGFGEPITIDDMARTAMFSKFHFSRIFQRVTGISPGRFLSAVRLRAAKRLLVTTSLTVADISHRVGYNSIGTFSTRFRNSVGVSPIEYRQLGGYAGICDDLPDGGAGVASVRGELRPPPDGVPGPVLIGMFADRLPQGNPVRCVVRRRPGPYSITGIPRGTWYVQAYATAADEAVGGRTDAEPGSAESAGTSFQAFQAQHGPIVVRSDSQPLIADLRLRRRNIFDPPVLPAALDSRAVPFGAVISAVGHRWVAAG